MPKTMCPGQDTAFWRPGDVYEVPCSECGAEVEFFKDDANRRCTNCGQLLRNPKLNLGCAQWCEHAKECLGYDPKEVMAEAEGSEASLVDQLIAELKKAAPDDQKLISHSLERLETAKRLMAGAEGQPRAVMTAAVLGSLAPGSVASIMKALAVDDLTQGTVEQIVAGRAGGEPPQSPEAKILADAEAIIGLRAALAAGDKPPAPGEMQTANGRMLAQALLEG